MASSPIVARWELSRRLAALRKERGLDVKAITDHLGFTRNYWSAVENDRTLIAADKLDSLLDLLEIDDAERAELTELREDGRKRGWWDEHSILDDDVKRLFGLEFGASRIRTFESSLLPGLLQLPDYARPMIESDPYFSPVDFDEYVAIREKRKRIFQHDVDYVALISEASLLQQPAGAEVQKRQLAYIADLVEERAPSVQIRVLPFATNPGVVANAGTLAFFEFDSRSQLPTVAWQEAARPLGAIEAEDEQFRRLKITWEHGLERSLDRHASLALIRHRSTRLS